MKKCIFTIPNPISVMEMTDFRVLGLNKIFAEKDLLKISKDHVHVLAVLSYFATSLFDKNSTEEVLWDIAENCISQLCLEDCVIYLLDKGKDTLIQKAAYGNKNKGERKILNPIAIPMGKGIVGEVAVTGTPIMVDDVSRDHRYILDDVFRASELAVPLVLDGKVIGVIDSEHSTQSFFDNHHLFLFELIAQLTGKKLRYILHREKTCFTNDNAYYQQLLRLLEQEKLYADAQLSLNSVAKQLDISANYLSQMVNNLSESSFSDLINSYRVEEAIRYLTDPAFAHYTIEGIGYEAGFNSRSAFYTAFKKKTGRTPVGYRVSPK